MRVQRCWVGLLLGATLAEVACASRVPVVTTPAYPDFLFPTTPASYADSPVAERHQDAWAFFQAGNLGTAEERFTALLGREPAFYPAAVALGWIGMARGRYDDAVVYFDQVVERVATYVPALVGRGEAYLATGNVEAALQSFEVALVAEPELTRVERLVSELRFASMTAGVANARAAADAGRFDEAERRYELVIATSPDSVFLYLELARVKQQQGQLVAALDRVQRATALNPEDSSALVLEGELHEALGALEAAEQAYRRADSLDSTEDTSTRLGRVRERVRFLALPVEYRSISSLEVITRGDLASLVGVRLGELLEEAAGMEQTIIITDTRNHWANPWILSVTQSGVMQVDAGYRFEPDRTVRRGGFAEVVAAVLDLIERIDPGQARRWQEARPYFSDMNTDHLNYRSAAQAVSAGVFQTLEDNTFHPTRAVGGQEAVAAVDRLIALAREVR